MLLVIKIQGVSESCAAKGTLGGQLPIFAFANQSREIVLCRSVPLTVAGFWTPCVLCYTLYSLKETLRDQCTPTQKMMLLLFIINPLIQENTNNVVKGTSNKAFCLFKIGFD